MRFNPSFLFTNIEGFIDLKNKYPDVPDDSIAICAIAIKQITLFKQLTDHVLNNDENNDPSLNYKFILEDMVGAIDTVLAELVSNFDSKNKS